MIQIGGFRHGTKNQYDFPAKQCAMYRYTGNASAEMTVCVTDDEIRREQNFFPCGHMGSGYPAKNSPFSLNLAAKQFRQ